MTVDTIFFFTITKEITVYMCLIISAHAFSCVCPRLPQDTENCAAIKEMQQGLDENNDGKVSFGEYLTLIGYLANSLSKKQQQQNAGATQEAL